MCNTIMRIRKREVCLAGYSSQRGNKSTILPRRDPMKVVFKFGTGNLHSKLSKAGLSEKVDELENDGCFTKESKGTKGR